MPFRDYYSVVPLPPPDGDSPGKFDAPGSVYLGTGSALERMADLRMLSNGPNWIHTRTYDSLASNNSVQGHGWRHSLMPTVTKASSGDWRSQDITITLDAYTTLTFEGLAQDTWQELDHRPLTLTHDVANYTLILESPTKYQWRFWDFDYATTGLRGKLYEVRDPSGNAYALTYSATGSWVTRVDDSDGHRITYTHSPTYAGPRLTMIKVYKAQTETNANLIGQVDYTYAGSDGDSNHGWKTGDLILVTTRERTTSDADGSLSIVRNTHYRYWKGTYDADDNPGTDHKLKYILRPENFSQFDATYDYSTATDAQVADYANVYVEYDTDYRVKELQERGTGCGGCGSGTSVGTTTLAWTANGTPPSSYNTWALHCQVDREDGTRLMVDVNKVHRVLNTVFQDNGASPTRTWVWHNEYSDHNRLIRTYLPSACGVYSFTAPSGPPMVAVSRLEGVIREYEYFDSGAAQDYLKAVTVKQGAGGTPIKLLGYGRTNAARPDLVTSTTVYEATDGSNGRTTSFAYTFHDANSNGIKEVTITHPSVSGAKNGPAVSAVDRQYYDTYGHLRWMQDGEGYVSYYGYDDVSTNGAYATGRRNLVVQDVDTTTLPASIAGDWSGNVPLERVGDGPSALNLEESSVIDFLGRVRKTTDAEGMVTYYSYYNGETWVYPWDDKEGECRLSPTIQRFDAEGRLEQSITLTMDAPIEGPNGSETGYDEGSVFIAAWTINEYNSAGQLTGTKRYHTIPSSGLGSRYTNYYQTTYAYDDMGRRQYVFEDVADESPHNREQVSQTVYDVLGRVIETRMGVSDNAHDATTNGVPEASMVTTAKTLFDASSNGVQDQDVGDGNVSWTLRYHGTGANDYNATEYRYDWRNRRCVTLPPAGPYSLVAYDNLGRVTASGTFSASTGLAPDVDPSSSAVSGSRLSLNKTYFDEVGRAYKTERFMDPADSTPADALASNTYYDRRGLTWAGDGPNTGIQFTKYDGAGRRIQTFSGTQFDTNKYTGDRPDYPDDDMGIVEVTDYTLDKVGNVTKTIHKELNHDDTNGMDLDGTDFVRTYVYNWYDAGHRLSATANYGTYNGDGWKDNGTAPTYGSSPPARSDDILVTSFAYSAAGHRNDVTGPDAVITHTDHDALGRSIAKTEDYGGLNRKTEYQYNGQGSLVRIIADPGADNDYADGVWAMDGSDTDQVTEYAYTDGRSARWVEEIRYPTGDGTVGSASTDKIVFAYNVDGTVATRTDQNGTVLTYGYDSLRRKTSEITTAFGTNVDRAAVSVTWVYDSAGRSQLVTVHSDHEPDTTSWTDAVNQIKNHYDTAGYLTTQEQEEDGAVDGGTRAVEFGYAYSGNYKRLQYVKYPDESRIWRGYTHSGGANTFQDTVNDTFSRVGQLAFGNGSIGDLIAEYDFNGMGRMVRRNHSDGSGWGGNNTRTDLWQGTPGTYAGLDRFGRTENLRMVDYNSTPVNFEQRTYAYDRSSNPLRIVNQVDTTRSQVLEYDDLDRLIRQDEGVYDSSGEAILLSDLTRRYDMDLLGNLTPTAGGFKQNAASATFTHTVNATNEITTLTRGNPAGAARVVYDDFDAGASDYWGTTYYGDFTATDGTFNVRSITGSGGSGKPRAEIQAAHTVDGGTRQAKIKLPPSSGQASGIIFALTPCTTVRGCWAAMIQAGSSHNITIRKYVGDDYTAEATASGTLSASKEYVLRVVRQQRHVDFMVEETDGTPVATLSFDSSEDLGVGKDGFIAHETDVSFDDFSFTRIDQFNPAAPRWASSAKTTLSSGVLTVETPAYGGLTKLEWAGDADYIAQADVNLSGGDWADLIVRQQDPDNYYAVRIG
ncbi:MAG: RHS repeat protein, partial [Phycisphaerae bacterium]|nr:RHS repeat protein [Phycisphaerae bacterium]